MTNLRLRWLLGISKWPTSALLAIGVFAAVSGAAMFAAGMFFRGGLSDFHSATAYGRGALIGCGGMLAWMGWLEAADAVVRMRWR